LKITREWENKFQIGTKKNRLLGHARIGFLYKSTRFNRTLLIKTLLLKSLQKIQDKKMPPALRLGANPPFQRVEETRGVCKKARLFAIVMAFCCIAARKLFSDAKN
jgi:hypothetical protein